jgi:hypothetical protein
MMVAIAFGLSGCGASAAPVIIDGFTLGAMEACSPPVDVDAAALDLSCAGYPRRAEAALDAREPGHPAIVSSKMYADGTQPGPIDVTGNGPVPVSPTRHPGPDVTVFVFTLADGSTRATGVSCTDGPPPACAGVPAYPN